MGSNALLQSHPSIPFSYTNFPHTQTQYLHPDGSTVQHRGAADRQGHGHQFGEKSVGMLVSPVAEHQLKDAVLILLRRCLETPT